MSISEVQHTALRLLRRARAGLVRSDNVTSGIPVDDSLTDRWDQEWIRYFKKEDPRPFLLRSDELELAADISGMAPAEMLSTILTTELSGAPMPALSIWCRGDDLLGKKVFELGCGPGLLGKQLALVAAQYVGVDYSRLALRIATLNSPGNCNYHHLSELPAISAHRGTCDTMVGRHFFIHQNYANATWILRLAHDLLREGGVVCADFFLRDPDTKGVIHEASDDLDARYPSAGFHFEDDEVERVGAENGFAVEDSKLDPIRQRRFVRYVKQ